MRRHSHRRSESAANPAVLKGRASRETLLPTAWLSNSLILKVTPQTRSCATTLLPRRGGQSPPRLLLLPQAPQGSLRPRQPLPSAGDRSSCPCSAGSHLPQKLAQDTRQLMAATSLYSDHSGPRERQHQPSSPSSLVLQQQAARTELYCPHSSSSVPSTPLKGRKRLLQPFKLFLIHLKLTPPAVVPRLTSQLPTRHGSFPSCCLWQEGIGKFS